MKKKTRSILEELNKIGQSRNNDLIIENRGINIIESAANLIDLIHKQFSESEADELERRFFNSIKSGDSKKFIRGIKKITESRKTIPKSE